MVAVYQTPELPRLVSHMTFDVTRDTPSPTDRQAEIAKMYDEKAAKALALLNDPHRFADAFWEPIFANQYSETDAVFSHAAPKVADEQRDEIMHLIRLAAVTPGADIDDVLGHAEDFLNNLQWAHRDFGRAMGTCLEGIRHLMLTCFHEIQAIAAEDAQRERESIVRIREQFMAARPVHAMAAD